jgi:hypothetical protein
MEILMDALMENEMALLKVALKVANMVELRAYKLAD